MAKKQTPVVAAKITPAAKALPAMPKVADPVAAAPVQAAVIEKSEVKGSGRVTKAPAAPKEITYATISQRAFEIYAGRGYAAGNPQDDWYEAERQLRAGL